MDQADVDQSDDVEETVLSRFFSHPSVTATLTQIAADNPEVEAAIGSLMSCPEVEAVKSSLASVFAGEFADDATRSLQLAAVAEGGDVDVFLRQNPGVVQLLLDSPLVGEIVACMETGLLRAMGHEPAECSANPRLADECFNLARLIVQHPALQAVLQPSPSPPPPPAPGDRQAQP